MSSRSKVETTGRSQPPEKIFGLVEVRTIARESMPPSRARERAATRSAEKAFAGGRSSAMTATPSRSSIETRLTGSRLRARRQSVLERGLVHAVVVGQLRMEGGGRNVAAADEDRLPFPGREHLDAGADRANSRGADEDRRNLAAQG